MFLNAVRAAADRKLDPDVLNNGISYFLGPLLGWTLPGIVLALVRHIRLTRWKQLRVRVIMTTDPQVRFQSTQHLIVLRTIMLSEKLPRPVLSLCGPSVVRLLSEWRGGAQPFDIAALRAEVVKATGIMASGTVSLITALPRLPPLTQT